MDASAFQLYLLLFQSLPIIVRARWLTFYGFDFGELRRFLQRQLEDFTVAPDVYRQSESKMLVITFATATLKAIHDTFRGGTRITSFKGLLIFHRSANNIA